MTKTLQEIASAIDAKLLGEPQCEITAVLPLNRSHEKAISFVNDTKYLDQLTDIKLGALIVNTSIQKKLPANFEIPILLVQDTYLAYAKVAQLFDSTPVPNPTISDKAAVAASATIGKNVYIGDFVSIGANVSIGDNSVIEAGTVIAQDAKVGVNCRIYSNASLYHSVEIGDNCIIHANAVIGSDGFGYANEQGEWVKIPQVGTVVIGNKVEIGAHTAIDRGAMDNTIIEDGVILDNHIHIAHNVQIGKNTAIAGCTAVAGSAKIGSYCTIAGRVSIIGHLDVCDKVHITACTFVNKSITTPGVYSSATTFQPNKDWQKSAVRFRQLDDMWRKLKSLEKEIRNLKEENNKDE